MGFIPAKCVKCGANIKVDESKDAGICEYCGTPYVTEKVIKNYNTYISNNYAGATIIGGDADNLLEMAKNAEEASNDEEANEYYSKVLELDPRNAEALFGKGYTACGMSKLADIRGYELISYTQKAVEIRYDNEFLIHILDKMVQMQNRVLSSLLNFYSENWESESVFKTIVDGFSEGEKISNYAKELIEKNELNNLSEGRTIYEDTIHMDIAFCVAICNRYRYKNYEKDEIYVQQVNDNIYQQYCDKYNELCVIMDELNPDWHRLQIDDKLTVDKEGCYIATCVYGSYDCPQVWTLRRFRDNKLYKNFIGKCFVKIYYKFSPKLVDCLGDTKIFNIMMRRCLDVFIRNLNKKGFYNTYYEDLKER